MQPATMESANEIPLLKKLGIRLAEIGDRHATMELEVDESHGNYLGGAHGGLIATLIDTVCFFPRPLLPSGRLVTTTNLNVAYIRPAGVGDRLIARSELLHLGRRTASLTARVTDGGGGSWPTGRSRSWCWMSRGPGDGGPPPLPEKYHSRKDDHVP
ncbi:PaaI family thioesterase [Geobacter pickeringii]|uniref:PaaI family thioesterase n=1 Tax=Geobacter pickeringii TaxID=345632 RepID=UPI000AEC2DFF|nr:PaaI family thioesterase [Geobacter pickeringii]